MYTKNKKAALYDPYLDTMGGGERHVLSIMQVLEQQGYDISIFWDQNLTNQIHNTLNLSFEKSPDYINGWANLSWLERYQTLKKFDLLITITDGSYFFSTARKTLIFCMVPQRKLYHMSTINRLKTWGNRFISNSLFTRSYLAQWGITSSVLYPYVTDDLVRLEGTKQKIILNVGRFFKHLHSKRQDVVIDWFIKFKKQFPVHQDAKLVLVGSTTEDDNAYVAELTQQIGNRNDILIKTNVSYTHLKQEYDRAAVLWHFTGMDVDSKRHPEKTEHLGITPLESMAAGCIPMAYALGGPTETIRDGENGYLFSTQEELFTKTDLILQDNLLSQRIRKTGKAHIVKYFSRQAFEHEVKRVILKET